ncbi:dentin sialophosphoprotein-like [Heptranchias perlo]|uniref:dentin sialophosphoprotein-like n=1 Tax=Heptranchias perlo TaxID=212740 RepID=UPI003559B1B5
MALMSYRVDLGPVGWKKGWRRILQRRDPERPQVSLLLPLPPWGAPRQGEAVGRPPPSMDTEGSLREIKDSLAEVDEKYKKAMVSNAQLDNEKTNLMYQVETLREGLLELEEQLAETHRGHEEKTKELDRQKHAYSNLQHQFEAMKETLKEREEMLTEIKELKQKQQSFAREISDLQETVEWKDKKIGALERQKEYFDAIRIDRDELRDEVVVLKERLKAYGLMTDGEAEDIGKEGSAHTEAAQTEPQAAAQQQSSDDGPLGGRHGLQMSNEILETVGKRGVLQNTGIDEQMEETGNREMLMDNVREKERTDKCEELTESETPAETVRANGDADQIERTAPELDDGEQSACDTESTGGKEVPEGGSGALGSDGGMQSCGSREGESERGLGVNGKQVQENVNWNPDREEGSQSDRGDPHPLGGIAEGMHPEVGNESAVAHDGSVGTGADNQTLVEETQQIVRNVLEKAIEIVQQRKCGHELDGEAGDKEEEVGVGSVQVEGGNLTGTQEKPAGPVHIEEKELDGAVIQEAEPVQMALGGTELCSTVQESAICTGSLHNDVGRGCQEAERVATIGEDGHRQSGEGMYSMDGLLQAGAVNGERSDQGGRDQSVQDELAATVEREDKVEETAGRAEIGNGSLTRAAMQEVERGEEVACHLKGERGPMVRDEAQQVVVDNKDPDWRDEVTEAGRAEGCLQEDGEVKEPGLGKENLPDEAASDPGAEQGDEAGQVMQQGKVEGSLQEIALTEGESEAATEVQSKAIEIDDEVRGHGEDEEEVKGSDAGEVKSQGWDDGEGNNIREDEDEVKDPDTGEVKSCGENEDKGEVKGHGDEREVKGPNIGEGKGNKEDKVEVRDHGLDESEVKSPRDDEDEEETKGSNVVQVKGQEVEEDKAKHSEDESEAKVHEEEKVEMKMLREVNGEFKGKGDEGEVQGPNASEVNGPREEESEVKGPREEEGEVKGPGEEEREVKGPGEEEREVKGPGEEEGEVKGPREEESEVKGPGEEENEVKGPGEEESEVKGPGEEEREVKGPGEEEGEVKGPGEEESEVKGPGEEEREVKGPREEEREVKGPGEEENEVKGPGEEENEVKGPGEEESEVKGPGEEEGEVKGPGEEEGEVKGPGEEEGEVKGPGEEEGEVKGPGEEEGDVKGPGEEEGEVKGPGEEENEVKGPGEEEREVKGPGEEESEVKGPSEEVEVKGPREEEEEGDEVKGLREEGDEVKGLREEGDEVKGLREEGDEVKGLREEGDEVKGLREEGDEVKFGLESEKLLHTNIPERAQEIGKEVSVVEESKEATFPDLQRAGCEEKEEVEGKTGIEETDFVSLGEARAVVQESGKENQVQSEATEETSEGKPENNTERVDKVTDSKGKQGAAREEETGIAEEATTQECLQVGDEEETGQVPETSSSIDEIEGSAQTSERAVSGLEEEDDRGRCEFSDYPEEVEQESVQQDPVKSGEVVDRAMGMQGGKEEEPVKEEGDMSGTSKEPQHKAQGYETRQERADGAPTSQSSVEEQVTVGDDEDAEEGGRFEWDEEASKILRDETQEKEAPEGEEERGEAPAGSEAEPKPVVSTGSREHIKPNADNSSGGVQTTHQGQEGGSLEQEGGSLEQEGGSQEQVGGHSGQEGGHNGQEEGHDGQERGSQGQEGGHSGQEGRHSGQEEGSQGQEGRHSGQEGGHSGQEGGCDGQERGSQGQEGGHSGHEGGHSGQEGGHSGQEGRHSGQEEGSQGQEGRHSGQEEGSQGQEGRHSGQEEGSQGQEGRHSGQEEGSQGQEGRHSGQEGGHSGQEEGHSGQEEGSQGQEGGHSGQEGRHSGQVEGSQGQEDGHSGQEGGHSGQEGGCDGLGTARTNSSNHQTSHNGGQPQDGGQREESGGSKRKGDTEEADEEMVRRPSTGETAKGSRRKSKSKDDCSIS